MSPLSPAETIAALIGPAVTYAWAPGDGVVFEWQRHDGTGRVRTTRGRIASGATADHAAHIGALLDEAITATPAACCGHTMGGHQPFCALS